MKRSGKTTIITYINIAGSSITTKLEALIAGGYTVQRIEEDLTYDYLHSSEENLWSILYLTGYLTKANDRDIVRSLPEGMSALTIPNAEIKEIFETTVIKWFAETARKWDRRKLFDAVWNGDTELMTEEMNRLLRKTISYHDYREDFYHAFMVGIFTGAGYSVESNREHGEGRSDIVVYDTTAGRVAVFEVKCADKLEKMASACDIAVKQIKERMYTKEFEDEYDGVSYYGIAFFKKRCMVKKELADS